MQGMGVRRRRRGSVKEMANGGREERERRVRHTLCLGNMDF